ncbi:hypothetical protein V494_03324, partial [Pseudogymnoascus sp. VKM F-4513 (FW-928)]
VAPSSSSGTQPIHPSGAYESPVKTSITEDGVIDIDVPLPSLFPSLPSALSSPSSSGILSAGGIGSGSGPELDGFEHYTRSAGEDEAALNVGGWVGRFHPDFVLQALPSPSSSDAAHSSTNDVVPRRPDPRCYGCGTHAPASAVDAAHGAGGEVDHHLHVSDRRYREFHAEKTHFEAANSAPFVTAAVCGGVGGELV